EGVDTAAAVEPDENAGGLQALDDLENVVRGDHGCTPPFGDTEATAGVRSPEEYSMDRDKLPVHVRKNRVWWDHLAASYAASGEAAWAETEPSWGIFGIPESAASLLPDDLTGLDAVELGCGTAYVAAWLARRGARPVGIDNSPNQLETARTLQREHGLDFPLHLGNAEATPFPDASFDLAISEYGASIWADPHRW